jgi:hypothetical protein
MPEPVIGRPTKLTPEIMEILAESIAMGLTTLQACNRAGIGEHTFYDWMKQEDFSQYIKKAVADRAFQRLKKIESGQSGWQSVAWIMERWQSAQWAPYRDRLLKQANAIDIDAEPKRLEG